MKNKVVSFHILSILLLLTRRKARLGDVLKCEFNIASIIEDSSSRGIGDLLLKDDNTYLFAYAWQAEENLSDAQKQAFFINNQVGTWEIKFEEGYSYDTDITQLDYADCSLSCVLENQGTVKSNEALNNIMSAYKVAS